MSINRLQYQIIIIVGMLSIWSIVGCSSNDEGVGLISGSSQGRAANQRLVNVGNETVRPIADKVFCTYFRVDPRSSSPNVWISHPVEVRREGKPVRLRDRLTASPSRRRQVAELRIVRKGTDVLAICRVRNQILETTERASFAEQRGDDRPSDTPIDRLGATSTYRQEDWADVSRDRKTETMILDAIRRQLEPPAQ